MLIFLEKSINLQDEIMKTDVVKKFQEIAKNKGMALTQNDVDVILDVLEQLLVQNTIIILERHGMSFTSWLIIN